MMARCHSWLLIPWCLVTLDLFASAAPAASSGIRDSIPSPVEVGGGYWNERCKRRISSPDAVPGHLHALCRRLRDVAESPRGVDQLEKALLEALIRSGLSAEEGVSEGDGTKYSREDGRPPKLLEKIRRFAEEEEEEEEETGETEIQSIDSNSPNGERGELHVSEDDDETRSSILAENSAGVVKRETSSDWANRQKFRGSLSALARYLISKRGYRRATRTKDAPGSRPTNGPRMSLYFLG